MTEPDTTKTPGQIAYEAEAAFWADGFDGEVRVYLPWGKLPPGDQRGYEAVAKAAKATGPEITFVLWDEDTDGVAVKHDGETVWTESTFDRLGQYLRFAAPLGVPVTIQIEG